MDEYPRWVKAQSDEFGEIDVVAASEAEAEAIKAKRAQFRLIVSAQGNRYEVVIPPK